VTSRQIFEAEVDQGTDNINVGRVVTPRRVNPVRSEWQTWELTVYDEDTGVEVYSLAAQPNTDSAVFFWYDTLQTPAVWGLDSEGFNMEHNVRQADVGAGVLKGGHTYLFEYAFISVAHGRMPIWFRHIVGPSSLVPS
jgi:hypothetical protein